MSQPIINLQVGSLQGQVAFFVFLYLYTGYTVKSINMAPIDWGEIMELNIDEVEEKADELAGSLSEVPSLLA